MGSMDNREKKKRRLALRTTLIRSPMPEAHVFVGKTNTKVMILAIDKFNTSTIINSTT